MAPDHSDEEHASEQLHSDSAAEAEPKSAEAASKNAKFSRKRTKTGCLTCRKRRIKCGEERPVCKNCVKSRRQCEGYNRPVTFKPTFDFRPVPHGGAHITFQAGPYPGPATPVVGLVPTANEFPTFDNLRPRPPGPPMPVYDAQGQQITAMDQYLGQFPMAVPPSTVADRRHGSHYPLLLHQQLPPLPSVPFPQSTVHAEAAMQAMAFDQEHISPGLPSIASDLGQGELSSPFVHAQAGPSIPQVFHYPYPDTPVSPLRSQQLPQNPNMDNLDRNRPFVDTSFQAPISDQPVRAFSMSHPFPSQPWLDSIRAPAFSVSSPTDYLLSPTSAGHQFGAFYPAAPPSFSQSAPATPYGFEHETQFPPRMSPTYFLNRAAVETQDDDYYDVNSQEEMDDDMSASEERGSDHQRTLSNLLAMTQITVPGSQMRRYDTFIYHGILNHYRVEWVANPLRNPATARVFAHFISVTGPMLSIYERHSKNTSVLFAKGAIPFSQQGLWTYTMPMAALHHQGLLHAMLALASLHIARLQGASTTPSMQHYAWALKRIHHCVGHPKKRLKLTTIAASMLLGFYEVMTAEHMKWNMHLAGSKQLYIETDFVKMTQEFRRMKLDKIARDEMQDQTRASLANLFPQDALLDQMPDVDDRVISRLVGREVRYGNHGSIETPQDRIPQTLDLSEYASLRDIYWWYCKQDVIQSILSGNALLMDFGRWHNCPPRAPLGRADAVYGSFDHLILLLGRIADFVSRDRTRKLRQMEANGGQWIPAAGMKLPRQLPQQYGPPPTPVSATGIGSILDDSFSVQAGSQTTNTGMAMPQFYGMAPAPSGDARMPTSYMSAQPTSSPQQDTVVPLGTDLVADMESALEEYSQIRAALLTFSNSLGESFEPLTSEYQPTMDTPFGPALFYRSYDIGCLWAYYNMAMIIAIRSHPHMPPAAHMAAGIAAQETSFFANEIGRITAGIVSGSPDEQPNPALGSALNESCLPSFFAAVQYQDPAQRHFTVTRIFNIAKRTGWGSAELIANGCETAWVRGAEAGRGPPYERVVRPHSSNTEDPRINGSWEHLDPNAIPDVMNETDRRLVTTNANARLNWAIGVMGMEGDMETLPIGH